MATTTTRFTVTPASPSVGAIIDGLDLREPLDEGTVGGILDAFHEHIALVFGDVHGDKSVPVRIHREKLIDDIFGPQTNHPHSLLDVSLDRIVVSATSPTAR